MKLPINKREKSTIKLKSALSLFHSFVLKEISCYSVYTGLNDIKDNAKTSGHKGGSHFKKMK